MKMQNKLKNKIILTNIILCALIISFSQNSYATEQNINIKEDTGYTQDYIKWNNISNEEKKNYIQPRKYAINLENNDSVQKKYTKLRSSIPSNFRLNNIIVRNQMNTGACWAFTTTSLLSTTYQKSFNTNIFKLFSPRHMEYATSYTFLDGINSKGFKKEVGDGGNIYYGLAYCTAGYGPVLEESMPFENNNNLIYLSQISGKNQEIKIKDYVEFPSLYKNVENGVITYSNGMEENSPYYVEYNESQVAQIRNKIKSHIMNYGAVSSYTNTNLNYFKNYYGNNTTYYCNNENEVANHAITIVGWDDNYSKENFQNTPINDGAYIVLNSWGDSWGDSGYYYISYDDVLIENDNVGIVSVANVDYNRIYQYDELGMNSGLGTAVNSIYVANQYNTENIETKNQYIKEVGISIIEQTNVELYANLQNDNKKDIVKIANSITLEPGYHVIKLDNPLKIEGNKFVIAAKLTGVSSNVYIPIEQKVANTAWETATASNGQSYISSDKVIWADLVSDLNIQDSNLCLKAFVEETDVRVESVALNTNEISLKPGGTYILSATVNPSNAANKNVFWASENEAVATVNQNGLVTANNPGSTRINATTYDGNFVASCIVNVIEDKINVKYCSHVQDIGWMDYVDSENVSGVAGRNLKVEAIKIFLENSSGHIKYQTHVQDIGWMDCVYDNQQSGTTGRNLKIEAIRIMLEGLDGYSVEYRAYVSGKWQNWVSDGKSAGTTGKNQKLEAIQIRIVKTENKVQTEPGITAMGHVQDIGWENWCENNNSYESIKIGLEGQGKKIEAMKLILTNIPEGAHIKYQAHVQDVGWMNYVGDGEISGTTGRNLKVEAVRIYLEGLYGYSVEYRGYVNGKWQNWVSDGKSAGTTGKNQKLEAIEIRIIKSENKVQTEPGITAMGHVQDIGWENWCENNNSYESIKIGLEGQGKKIEAMKLILTNIPEGAHIKYQTHVQDIGWMDFVEDGQVSGTTGRNLKVEAVRIYLEGLPGYSVYYRGYVSGQWQNWVCNGQEAGTTGRNLKMEAVEIKIVKN